jgi:hypothetical protein
MTTIMGNVLASESVSLASQRVLDIAEQSDRNLRKALLMLEAVSIQPYVSRFESGD